MSLSLRRRIPYGVLDIAFVYRASQMLLAPGADWLVARALSQLLARYSPGPRALDVGCGPRSLLEGRVAHPVGVDITREYMDVFRKRGGVGVVGSAIRLPLPTASFDSVWSIGLLHHLDDDDARRAVAEMFRVAGKGGHVFVIDAVLPRHWWGNPLAFAVRKADRGQYVRSEEALVGVLKSLAPFETRRTLYALNGLEILIAHARSPL